MTAGTSVKINAAISIVTILIVTILNYNLNRNAAKKDQIDTELKARPNFGYVDGQDEALKEYVNAQDEALSKALKDYVISIDGRLKDQNDYLKMLVKNQLKP